jgi:hypothetical protein
MKLKRKLISFSRFQTMKKREKNWDRNYLSLANYGLSNSLESRPKPLATELIKSL